jgi:hypothetical protein
MDCDTIRELLLQMPYNELGQEEKDRVRDHLKTCAACRNELRDHERVKEFSKTLHLSAPADDRRAESIHKILEAINREPQREDKTRKIQMIPARNNLYRIFRIVTNLAAVFLIGLFFYQQIEIKKNLENLQSIIDLQDKYSSEKKNPFTTIEFTSLPDDQIKLLIREYEKVLRENNNILTYLRINHPAIYREILQNKTTQKKSSENL